ncbi:uncharacterized protein G2W53_031466 [Senna tora]|uniref:Uncharacterized protein n=1 Tax=Senna tora TaxID=362788 RepID=A0A834T9A1_9FABA|nr:uncharacterized protein G2W53_031466 [Senna tora]
MNSEKVLSATRVGNEIWEERKCRMRVRCSGGSLLSGNRRGNGDIGAGIKFIPIIVQVKSSKPDSAIVAFHILCGSLGIRE